MLKGKYFCHDLKRIDLIKKQKYVQGAPKTNRQLLELVIKQKIEVGQKWIVFRKQTPIKIQYEAPFQILKKIS